MVPPKAALAALPSQPSPAAAGWYASVAAAGAFTAPLPSAALAAPAGTEMDSCTGWSRVATKPSTYSRPEPRWYTTSTLRGRGGGWRASGGRGLMSGGWQGRRSARAGSCRPLQGASCRGRRCTRQVAGRGLRAGRPPAVARGRGAHRYTPATRNRASGLACSSGRPKSIVHSGSGLEVEGPGWSQVMDTCRGGGGRASGEAAARAHGACKGRRRERRPARRRGLQAHPRGRPDRPGRRRRPHMAPTWKVWAEGPACSSERPAPPGAGSQGAAGRSSVRARARNSSNATRSSFSGRISRATGFPTRPRAPWAPGRLRHAFS